MSHALFSTFESKCSHNQNYLHYVNHETHHRDRIDENLCVHQSIDPFISCQIRVVLVVIAVRDILRHRFQHAFDRVLQDFGDPTKAEYCFKLQKLGNSGEFVFWDAVELESLVQEVIALHGQKQPFRHAKIGKF